MSALSSVALFSIWRSIIKKAPSQGKKDYGLAYLAGALSVWTLIAVWSLLDLNLPAPFAEAVRSLFSTVNSLLYLLAIQHFDYAYEGMRRRRWQVAVVSTGVLTVVVTMTVSWTCYDKNVPEDVANAAVNWPDLLFSVPAIVALAIAFWRSFFFRGYATIAWLSVVTMLLAMILQVPDVVPGWLSDAEHRQIDNWVTLSTYALIIMFCFALATSWGVEEFSLPKPSHTHLVFQGCENGRWRVQLRIREQRIDVGLPHVAMKNLLSIIGKRLQDLDQGWHSVEDLNGGHVDIRRIAMPFAEALQDSELLVNTSDEKAYLAKARRLLFDYQNPGQFRLRLPLTNLLFREGFFQKKNEMLDAMRSRRERAEVERLFEEVSAWQERTRTPQNDNA